MKNNLLCLLLTVCICCIYLSACDFNITTKDVPLEDDVLDNNTQKEEEQKDESGFFVEEVDDELYTGSGYRIFYRGERLSGDVVIPSEIDGCTVEVLSKHLFKDNNGVTSVTIPKTVTRIDAEAFYNCKNLTKIIFEDGSMLDRIEYNAFFGCEKLNMFNSNLNGEMNIPENVTLIHVGAFAGTAFDRININSKIDHIGDLAFSEMENLTEINVADSQKYFSEDGVLYDYNGCLMKFPQAKICHTFSVPEFVNNVKIRFIAQEAFKDNKDIEAVYLYNILSIDKEAFFGCEKLSTVVAPNVELVGDNAFLNTPFSVSGTP